MASSQHHSQAREKRRAPCAHWSHPLQLVAHQARELLDTGQWHTFLAFLFYPGLTGHSPENQEGTASLSVTLPKEGPGNATDHDS